MIIRGGRILRVIRKLQEEENQARVRENKQREKLRNRIVVVRKRRTE